MSVKEWLPPMLRAYYAETRKFDRDAWPESYLGTAQEERGGYGQGAVRQHYKEVRGRDGLEIRRAMEGMPYELRAIVDAHYAAAKVPVKQKSKALGVSVPKYWTLLDCAYFYIAGRLDTQRIDSSANLVVDIRI